MTNNPKGNKPIGLTSQQAKILQEQYGKNELVPIHKEIFLRKLISIICAPMFLLLIIAAAIYFLLGSPQDGIIMLIFVAVIIGIDVVQEWKTDKTLNALRELSSPHITVIRDGVEQSIASVDLVPGDLIKVCEGIKIPADGWIIACSDFCINESTLTGESDEVWKTSKGSDSPYKDYWRNDYCYAGTLVTHGSAIICVERIGSSTEYGKISTHIANAPKAISSLQKQTDKLVLTCALIAGILFLLVSMFTWLTLSELPLLDRLIQSILSGVTLAMAMIPEEFPVVLTVFLSMGAWRLAKKHSLVRRLNCIETLGEISVLCVDKTGTLTKNQMTVQSLWTQNSEMQFFIEVLGLACEPEAYDPMEKAILHYCSTHGFPQNTLFQNELIQEYPFTNELKMMGHIWKRKKDILIAAKGSPEQIFTICKLTAAEFEAAQRKNEELSRQGLRVIAVASSVLENKTKIPALITDSRLSLLGLIGLADPLRENVEKDIAVCRNAGIRVVMITGDSTTTAAAIAQKIGLIQNNSVLTGKSLQTMSDHQLRKAVNEVSIFSRVIPEHKMRIVKALKENGETVAMTGDGVNDAPALKYADIGIAMGRSGSEVAREASDLILMDDNFTTIVETIQDGRRIFDNIRKAIGYIFTIHIPIAASALLAPLLGISPAGLLLLPLHIVLMELLIDPTCSIVLERQPSDRNIMNRLPRNPKEKLLDGKLLCKSILQGLMLFAASFGSYYFMLTKNPEDTPAARTVGLVILILGNLLLVLVNSSNWDFALHMIRQLSQDKILWIAALFTIVLLFFILYTPLSVFLKLVPLSALQLLFCLLAALVSVLWYELIKSIRHYLVKRKALQ